MKTKNDFISEQMQIIEKVVKDFPHESKIIQFTNYELSFRQIHGKLGADNEIHLVNFNYKDGEILRIASYNEEYLDQLNAELQYEKGAWYIDENWSRHIPMNNDFVFDYEVALEYFLNKIDLTFKSTVGKIQHHGRMTYYVINEIVGS